MIASGLNMNSGSVEGMRIAGDRAPQHPGPQARAAGLRHPPRQPRSRERLERLLDAAAEVLAQEGAQALTTRRIAEVAGVPIGSLYRLFADKHAIVEALALRWWRELVDLVEGVAEVDAREPLDAVAAAVLEALAAGLRARPGFLALWFGGLRDERLRDVTRPLRGEFAAAVERTLAVHWPAISAAERRAAAEIAVLAGDGLLREAFRQNPDGDPRVLAEAAVMLGSYLEARLGPRAR
jgi:AcrR family transcriptional regulator